MSLSLSSGFALALALSLNDPQTADLFKGKAAGKLPLTGLAPSKLIPDLCLVKYRVTTGSPECQAFFDQGLGYYYSYVWMEAARSFETAARHDPNCAMAWLSLSKALERWGKNNHPEALKKAQALLPRVSQRENFLITARLQEKGMLPGVGDADARLKAAIATIDSLLSQYEDDEEGWYARAQLASGGKLFGGQIAGVLFYKALLKYNPLHPGAHHELVHYYENGKRPALGWFHAEKYIESSPGLPHAFHMQAHLATRLGRWAQTTDWSARAVELERAYHKAMTVKPKEDHQFSHHIETLMLSLTHDGRFQEARKLKEQSIRDGYKQPLPWFRLHMVERDYDEALQVVAQHFKKDKVTASYLSALAYLRRGELDRAEAMVHVLQEAYTSKRSDKQLELRLWETQGMLLCRRGDAEAGLKLLAKTVEKTKDDYKHHAWGNGSFYMETWGIEALHVGRWDVAEEAFLEALAHDTGSIRGALGMQVLCEHQGRTEEALRFAEKAQVCWRKADPGRLQMDLGWMRGEMPVANTVE